MKKVSIILLMLLSSSLFCQKIIIPTGKYEEVNKFLKSTTYVVAESNFSCYSMTMKSIINDYWKITPIKIITPKEFETLKKDENNSFLMLNKVYFEQDKTKTLFDFLCLTIGGNYSSVDKMPTLCAIPLCFTDSDDEDYCYKLGLMLHFIQKHIEICKNDPNINSDKILSLYKRNINELRNKTLYVVKDEIEHDLRNNSNFSNYYKYNFQYCTSDNIENLIKNKDKNAVIIHRIGNKGSDELAYSVTILIDTKNAEIYYYDIDKLRRKDNVLLQSSDLEKINKAIK